MQTKTKANRLINETSPYLIQHAYNPVEWYPWSEDALGRAKRESKPIFLSIGYSACHWCHVMEHESFENEEIAKVMNEHFINIKVDREERPDLDHIYMSAVQVLTQHGGWPMSVFLTPNLEPFYGGTYFPPEDRMGMPGFKKVLLGVANAWEQRRDEILTTAKQLTEALQGMNQHAGALEIPSVSLIASAAERALENYDGEFGGFGNAPKFFHTMDLRLLLRQWKHTKDDKFLQPVVSTLTQLAGGGIYDQVGGGFHRYSTDRRWLVPHFEKMLYDNALLAETYLEAYQATQNVEFARVSRETLNYVLREMTSPDGGFYSTQDADTEGVEGKFYVWSKAEIEKTLDKDLAELVCRIFDVSESGNWEGQNILNRPTIAPQTGTDKEWMEDSIALAFRKLYEERLKRVAPHRDEKILASWNGLMIHSMALGHQILGDDRYLSAAVAAADLIWDQFRVPGSAPVALLHTYKDGVARLNGYLDDYAAYLNALITLYESTFERKWMERASELAAALILRFWDQSKGDFYFTSRDHEKLITRPKEIHDGATPSATGMAITALLRLSTLMGKKEWFGLAQGALQTLTETMKQIPGAAGTSLAALDFVTDKTVELVIAPSDSAEETENVLRALRMKFVPNKVVAVSQIPAPNEITPLLRGKQPVSGKITLYECHGFTCQAPVVGMDAILERINQW